MTPQSFWECSESTVHECHEDMTEYVEIGSFYLESHHGLDRTFRSLLNFLPNTCELANWSLPPSFSPSLLGSMLVRMAPSSSLASSSTLSSVLVAKHNLSPDCLKSSWTPRTLQRVLKSSSKNLADLLSWKRPAMGETWIASTMVLKRAGFETPRLCT